MLWDSLPEMMFIDLSRLESFRSGHSSLLVKMRPSVTTMPLVRQPIGELPFGKLWLMTTSDIPVAYLLDVPRCPMFVGRNYASVMLRGRPHVDPRRILVDGKLVIFGDDAAMTAIVATRRLM